MTVEIFDSYPEMSRRAAELIAKDMNRVQAEGRDFVLGLATGSTPIGTYGELIEMNRRGKIDFTHVKTFNLDEYLGLYPGHEQSFNKFMYDNLFLYVNIKNENVRVPYGMAEDYDEWCRSYEEAIDAAGGIDLQLLGIGSDGHIGFNEPCGEFPENTHTVDLTESTIRDNSRFFASEDEVPTRAVTMGVGTVMRARKIVMVVNGLNKAEAVKAMIEGPVDPAMPASKLQEHPDVTILLDQAAASQLG